MLPQILVLDRGLGMECTEGQNKKENKRSEKTYPGPSRNPLKLKQIMKFCFCRVVRSAAGSAREQRELCWTLVWCLVCKGRMGTACMTVAVHFVRDANSWFHPTLLCSKWSYNSGQHQTFWLTRPGLFRGLLGYFCTKGTSPCPVFAGMLSCILAAQQNVSHSW